MSLEGLYPYPVKRVTLCSHDCAYIDEGQNRGKKADGAPMVFLHGFSVNLSCFAPVYPHFAEAHRVVGLDYPGYYLSEKKELPYDIPFAARAVAELIDKLGLGKAVLVGSSMGGAIAMETALTRPDLVSALVLAAPGGFSGRSPLLSAIVGLQLALFPKRKVVSTMSARLPGRVPTFFADKAHPFIKTILAGYDGMKVRPDYPLWMLTLARMARSQLRADFTGRARGITAPILVVWGDHDEVLPPAGAQMAQRAMGDRARVVMLSGVGHLPFVEATQRFNREVDDFLGELGL